MYDHPTKYSFVGPADRGYHPKAATQASWTPKPPRPKHDGPLIEAAEFNRHPDSYLIVPYGNLNAKPMSKSTASKVKWTRLIQLFLRICALLGALGMLVCVICIRETEAITAWIIRVPVSHMGTQCIPVAVLTSHLACCCYTTHCLRDIPPFEVFKTTYADIFGQLYDLCCYIGRWTRPFLCFHSVGSKGQVHGASGHARPLEDPLWRRSINMADHIRNISLQCC